MAEENDLGWKFRPLDENGEPVEKKEEPAKEETVTEVDASQEKKEETPEVKEKEEVEPGTSRTGTVNPEDENIAQVESQEPEKDSEPNVEVSTEEVKEQQKEIDEQQVLAYLKNRHQKEFSSLEDVLSNIEKPQSQELSEDIQTYLKFREETGRSMQDFILAQRDVSALDDSAALFEFYKETKPHLSADDINYLITENFGYDEEVDEERDIKKKKIAYKDEVYKAKQHLTDLANKYKVPLESSGKPLEADAKEAVEFYTKYKEDASNQEKQSKQLQEVFRQKTDKLFSDEFKGFEFNVGKKKLMFKLSSPNEVKQSQSDINKMLSRFTDNESGALNDAYLFHKSAFAMTNPDLIAKLAYEQGIADATNNIVKETKNLDMTVRTNKVEGESGTRFRVLDSEGDFSGGLKIRKK